jgi:hypothetical protein
MEKENKEGLNQIGCDEYRLVLEKILDLTKKSSNGELFRINELVKTILKK